MTAAWRADRVGRPGLAVRALAGAFASATLASAALAISGAAVAAQQGELPDSLTVERAVRLALERNPQIRSASATADAAGADQRAAWGDFLPSASANISFRRNSFTRTTFEGEEGLSETLPEPLESTSKSTSQGLSFSWDLLDGGRRIASLRQSSASVRAAQRRLDDARRTVTAAVRRAFYEALKRQRLLELAERQVADRRLELELARRRYEIAAVDRTEVLGAENGLLNARISLLAEQGNLEAELRGLAVEMGFPAEAGLGLSLADAEAAPDATTLDLEALVERAVGSDPEVLALEAEREAASAGLWAARSAYLPTITLSYGLSRSQSLGPEDPFFVFDPSDHASSFGVSASWNLFDGFQRERQTAQASSSRRRAEQDLVRRRLEVQREVGRLVTRIEVAARTLELRERSFAIAEERLDMTREMYRQGDPSVDFVTLQSAVSELTSAERSLIDQRYEYLKSWSDLEEFVGEVR